VGNEQGHTDGSAGDGGKHGVAEVVSEAGVELPAFELEGSGDRMRIQSGRVGAAGTAVKLGPGALAILGAGGIGGMQGVCTGLGGVLGDCALRLHDDADGVWAGLADTWQPEADGGVVQDLPQLPKLLAAVSGKRPGRLGPSPHAKLRGGSCGEVSGVAHHITVCIERKF
jgi:hypothetical protein